MSNGVRAVSDFLFRPGPTIAVQEFFGPGFAGLFRVLTQFGTTWGVVFVVGLALWLWRRSDAYALIAIVVLEAVVSFGLNQFLSVPRPDAPGVIKYEHVQVGSFPSGHVFLATVLWGLLSARKRIPIWLFVVPVLVVAVARLYLGVHYLADVVAGAVAGLIVIAAFVRVWPRAERPLAGWSSTAWIAVALVALGVVLAGFLSGFFGDNPFKWHAAGLVLGGVPALLLERRYVHQVPSRPDAGTRMLKIALALLVLLPMVWLDRVAGERPYILGAALVAIGALWAWLLAPLWFVRMDLARSPMPDRSARAWHALRSTVLTIAAVVAALLIYGVAVEPRFYLDVTHETARLPGLPPAWDGRRIAVIGDFQVGMWWDNPGMASRAVERAIEERPAALLLLGDFVYHAAESRAAQVETTRDILAPLRRSGIPVFAVLGNHDWAIAKQGSEADHALGRAVRRMLEDLGIRILHNRAAVLTPAGAAGSPLYIVGVGSHYLDEDRPAEALADVPAAAARVILMHHPDSFQAMPPGTAPLAVAGHTHGGQLALPFAPHWSWLTFTKSDNVQADGWADPRYGKAGNRLYVNRGIGMSLVPVRIGAPPELTIFTLRSRDAAAPAEGERGKTGT